MPGGVSSRFAGARTLIVKAAQSSNPRKQKNALRTASKRMRSALGAITKAQNSRATGINSSCADALRSVVIDIRNRLDTLQF